MPGGDAVVATCRWRGRCWRVNDAVNAQNLVSSVAFDAKFVSPHGSARQQDDDTLVFVRHIWGTRHTCGSYLRYLPYFNIRLPFRCVPHVASTRRLVMIYCTMFIFNAKSVSSSLFRSCLSRDRFRLALFTRLFIFSRSCSCPPLGPFLRCLLRRIWQCFRSLQSLRRARQLLHFRRHHAFFTL